MFDHQSHINQMFLFKRNIRNRKLNVNLTTYKQPYGFYNYFFFIFVYLLHIVKLLIIIALFPIWYNYVHTYGMCYNEKTFISYP